MKLALTFDRAWFSQRFLSLPPLVAVSYFTQYVTITEKLCLWLWFREGARREEREGDGTVVSREGERPHR